MAKMSSGFFIARVSFFGLRSMGMTLKRRASSCVTALTTSSPICISVRST